MINVARLYNFVQLPAVDFQLASQLLLPLRSRVCKVWVLRRPGEGIITPNLFSTFFSVTYYFRLWLRPFTLRRSIICIWKVRHSAPVRRLSRSLLISQIWHNSLENSEALTVFQYIFFDLLHIYMAYECMNEWSNECVARYQVGGEMEAEIKEFGNVLFLATSSQVDVFSWLCQQWWWFLVLLFSSSLSVPSL